MAIVRSIIKHGWIYKHLKGIIKLWRWGYTLHIVIFLRKRYLYSVGILCASRGEFIILPNIYICMLIISFKNTNYYSHCLTLQVSRSLNVKKSWYLMKKEYIKHWTLSTVLLEHDIKFITIGGGLFSWDPYCIIVLCIVLQNQLALFYGCFIIFDITFVSRYPKLFSNRIFILTTAFLKQINSFNTML